MNELIVTFEGQQWIYFKTDAQTVDKGLQEFEETCDNAGINLDNMNIFTVTLQDSEGNMLQHKVINPPHTEEEKI